MSKREIDKLLDEAWSLADRVGELKNSMPKNLKRDYLNTAHISLIQAANVIANASASRIDGMSGGDR